MAFATKVGALTLKMAGLLRSEANLGFLVLLYLIRFYVEGFDLNAVRNVDAVQSKDDRFSLLESDRIGIIGKFFGNDFNSFW